MSSVKEELGIIVAPFGIEADHPRNDDLLIQSIPGLRMRSAIDGTKPIIDAKTGDPLIPVDQSRHLGTFPKVPGMQLHIDPFRLTYVLRDPLHDDEQMCERIKKWMNTYAALKTDGKIRGREPLKGTLDSHRMKTLVREIVNIVESKEAKVIKGSLPSMDDVDELPGEYLLNPGLRTGTTQPVYEKDWDEWVANLSRTGG